MNAANLRAQACRNEPRVVPFRRLTARELSVVQYAALGHTYKYMAYELGLSISAIAVAFHRALRKLGIGSRSDLIRTFGGLGLGDRRRTRR